MPGSCTRVLLVDDFEPWRRFVATALEKHPEFEVVGEGADGWEALEKAQALEPDLVLLDIGLPKLNGILAARKISERVPRAKILFLSENDSWDIAEEALRTGALGYVVKSDAGGELLPAIEAVLQNELFVSSRLSADATLEPVEKCVVGRNAR